MIQRIAPYRGTGRFTVDPKTVPEVCQREILDLLMPPLKTAIETANRQIKATKAHFGMPDANGLLLLVNDGNYSLEFETILWMLGQLLKPRPASSTCGKAAVRYKSVDHVAFITVNMPARMPGISHDVLLWSNCERDDQIIPIEFLDRLRAGWISFVRQHIFGGPLPVYEFEEGFDMAKDTKYIQAARKPPRMSPR